MDKVTHMMDYVMDESIDGDKCDGSDGKNEKSLNNQDSVESKTKRNTENSRQTEFLEMPSYRSPKESQAQRGQATTDNQSVITVGDRVEITDCPGHWNWASPFTVEAIEGEMVKLEMVGELVEIERLYCSGANNKS